MSILTDKDINKLIFHRDLVIHPFEKKSVTGVGYDLQIGIIKPLTEIESFVETDEFFSIPPKCYFIVISTEFVWLSGSLLGTLHSRGTLAAKGLYTNATNIDPNFKGQLIMSMHNISEAPIIISKNPLPTYITMIIHEVRTKSDQLFNNEGTKNSSRVLNDMIDNIYHDESIYPSQKRNCYEMMKFMKSSDYKYAYEFEEKIREARKVIHPERLKTVRNALTLLNIVFAVLVFAVISTLLYFIGDMFYSKLNFKESLKQNIPIIAAAVTIMGLIYNWRKNNTK